jgi:hypothetical protein
MMRSEPWPRSEQSLPPRNRCMAGLLALLCWLIGVPGCEAEISSASRLRRPRLLAIQAEPVNPPLGTSTTLRPLVYLPEGESVAYQWSWCPVPTHSENGFLCPFDQAALDRLAVAAGLGEVPPLALGTSETVRFTNPFPPDLLAGLCAGESSATDLFMSGVDTGKASRLHSCTLATLSVQVMLTIQASTTDTGVVSLHLPIDLTTPGNQNPFLTGLSVMVPQPQRPIDEAGLVVVPRDTKVRLLAGLDPAQAEPYLDWQTGPEGQRLKDDAGNDLLGLNPERLTLSWFAEGGGFENRTTSWNATTLDSKGQVFPFQQAIENDWSTPNREDFPAASSVVLVVVRDNRGGVAWVRARAGLEDAP